MTEKQNSTKKLVPIHVIEIGSCIVATIYRRETASGFGYLDFTLERIIRKTTGKQNRSITFFEQHEDALIQAAGKAAQWIRENNHATNDHDTN